MRLLERDPFFESLAVYADEARIGEGRLVLVAGEAGVGKTALLECFERDLPDATWAWGTCDGLFTPRPLGPVFDLAEQWGGELRDVCSSGAGREAIFTAVLRRLGAPGRLKVVVVQDVHWADEATLDLLRFLGRRLRGLRLLLLVSYRDDGLAPDDPLRTVLGELGAERTTRRIALPPLSEAAVRELAASAAIEPAELFRLTGGNPFFLTEVLGAGAGVGAAALPSSAREAVLARVSGLPADVRAVLGLAALAGFRVDPRRLEQVQPDAAAALDAGLASGVLVDDGEGLRFRHEIARLVLADSVPVHRRAKMHAALLAALRASGSDDDARAAYHAEGAEDGAAVLEFALRAARKAAELAAHREAAAQCERALRFAGGRLPAERAALYDTFATELSLVDRWQEAADAELGALSLWRTAGDRVREGDTLRRLSRALWRLCRGAEADAAAREALTLLESSPPGPELAWTYSGLAFMRAGQNDCESAIKLTRRSQELAERLNLPAVLSDALNTEACAAASLGRPWSDLMRRALEVALAAGLEEQAGRAYANLHMLQNGERRIAAAERTYGDAVAYCDDHDVGTFGTCLRGERTIWLERVGRWSEAVELCEELLSRSGPSPINRLHPLVTLGRIRASRGQDDIWVPMDEAAAWADGTGQPEWIAFVRLARIQAAWLEGRTDAARAELAHAAARADHCDGWVQAEVAVWHRRLGLPVPALPAVTGPSTLQLAGRHLEAAAAWEALGCPYEAALARQDSGEEAALREALRSFDALGAAAAARLTRREMRRHGLISVPAGPRATTRSRRFGLTPREQEVLDLLADGLSNVDISRRLFISDRTVDHHVTAVLAKMGVPSRGLAAREAHRLGLLDGPARQSHGAAK